nr:GTPase Era, mitochondrial-like [Cherax quadricarinatus]
MMIGRCLLQVLRGVRCQHLQVRHLNHAKTGDEKIWENIYQREVPRTMEEMGLALQKEVQSPPDARLLKVAIVGVPNCGKSTLINTLVGWRVCSVSYKVHTTEVRARAVHNMGSTQLVFLDTPGLVTPKEITKHGLKRSLVTETELSLHEADLIAVVHDVSNHFTRHDLHPRVLRLLTLYPTLPSVLVLNKVDKAKNKQILLEITRILTEGVVGGHTSHQVIKKSISLDQETLLCKSLARNSEQLECKTTNFDYIDGSQDFEMNSRRENLEEEFEEDSVHGGDHKILCDISHLNEKDVLEGKILLTEQQVSEFIKNRKSWPKFEEVFMVSALDGTGIDDLRQFLFSKAYSRPWIFSSQVVTDQNPEEIVLSTVREKFLNAFRSEIPYTLQFKIEYWELTQSEVLSIMVQVMCKREGLVRLIVGGSGSVVSQIAKASEQSLRNTFRTEVMLKLNVVSSSKKKKHKR